MTTIPKDETKTYKACRRAMVTLYVLAAAAAAFCIPGAAGLLTSERLTPGTVIAAAMFGAVVTAAAVTAFVLPGYFRTCRVTVGSREIVSVRGAVVEKTVFMPMKAVRSVTVIRPRSGRLTGMNFLILNTLGARLTLPFLSGEDCDSICGFVNSAIMQRSEAKMQDCSSFPAKSEDVTQGEK
ncbi:MAG: PH domain-containing protein [Ruminococcus sp.]|nr:PH domain-containing protein [Ruminococcus sp.]